MPEPDVSSDPAEPQDRAAKEPPRPRKVYESTLLPDRRRRHVPTWLALPGLFVVLAAAIFLLYRFTHARRQIDTVGAVVYSVAPSGLFIAPADGSAARPLKTVGAGPTWPVFSPDGNRIAYLASHSGAQREIFVEDADGANAVQATHSGLSKTLPSFAPSSNDTIAYLAGGALYSTNLIDNSTDRILPAPPRKGSDTSDLGTTPTVVSYTWSPVKDPAKQALAAVLDINGDQFLAIQPGPDENVITTRNNDPNAPPLIDGDSLTCGWTPDGSAVAAAVIGAKGPQGKSLSGIFFINTKGQIASSAVAPALGRPVGPENPIFTPDGQAIIFQVWSQPDLAHRKPLGIFAAPGNGSAAPQLIARLDGRQLKLDPAGHNLFFIAPRRDGGHDLMEFALDTQSVRRLSDGQQDVTAFAVSPQVPRQK